jgi:hypothetical protein
MMVTHGSVTVTVTCGSCRDLEWKGEGNYVSSPEQRGPRGKIQIFDKKF